MLRRAVLAGALILLVFCNKSESGDSLGSAVATSAGSSKPQGSAGNFSAELARELGAGTTKPESAAAKSPGELFAAGGDAQAGDAQAGDAQAGNAKAGMKPDLGARAGGEKAESAAVATAEKGATPAP